MSSISINAQLQSLLDGFAAQTGGSTTTAYQRIYNAITASPELTSQLNAGAASGALTRIVFIAQGREVSAGYYQSGGIYIGAEFLNPRDRPPRSQNDLASLPLGS